VTAMQRRRGMTILVSGLAAGMLLAACGGSDDSASDRAGEDTAAEETAAEGTSGDEGADDGDGAMDGACDAYADYMGNEDTTVDVFTSILPPEQQLFEEAWAQFEECTGIDIVFEGSEIFEAELPTRIAQGNAPDIAWISSPRALSRLVSDGGPVAAPLETEKLVDENWQPVWKQYGTVEGIFYAAPLSAQMNSLVWYSPEMFAENGYEIPKSWDEMWALSDQMVADGIRPWCGGLESEGATGWPASSWLAEVVLRLFGGDGYDRWVAGDLDFDSPEISAAMDVLAGWMKNPEYVNGGFGDVSTIASTSVVDVGTSVLDATCGFFQAGEFYFQIWGQLDPSAVVGPDDKVYAFHLPEVSGQFPQPIIGTGDFVVAFDDRSEVQAVQTFMATPQFQSMRAELGNWTTANAGTPLSAYESGSIQALAASFLTSPDTTFRFDSAELMPRPIGTGEEWAQLTAWFAEDRPTAEVLSAIEGAWPQ
jgi:alpha-glucoside transport system substrate-binding protein